MLLLWLIIIPFVFSLLSLSMEIIKRIKIAKYISLIGLNITLVLCIIEWLKKKSQLDTNIHDNFIWKSELSYPWISKFGIEFHLGLDSFSFIMVILTCFFGIISLLIQTEKKNKSHKIFYFYFMSMIGSIIAILISLDLFLFFCFWELLSIPIYFILIFNGKKTVYKQDRISIANQFLMYSQISGILFLCGSLFLSLLYYDLHHYWTFNYNLLSNMLISSEKNQIFILLLFCFSFFIKIPLIPFHGWFIKVQKISPISGSLDVTGLLIKVAVYSLIRFHFIFYPKIVEKFSIFLIIISLSNIVYSSYMAMSKKDIRQILAYSAISHASMVLIGLCNINIWSYQGIILNVIANTISIGSLLILSSQLYRNLKTHNIDRMGGLWGNINFIPFFFLFFLFSNLGIPGTANFLSEFIIISHFFNNYPIISFLISFCFLFSSIYSLRLFQKIFYGKMNRMSLFENNGFIEVIILSFLSVLTIYIGLFPKYFLNFYL
ncbi:NADH-quinone oxidoreductase subunit M [Buchnera aphidicola (Kurisakia onigurumii)]|uniref:complex I subunit 4 family protein n=1 Tax=Buchnera aphidicola TaxID=9 RepID=UPI0031B6FD1D